MTPFCQRGLAAVALVALAPGLARADTTASYDAFASIDISILTTGTATLITDEDGLEDPFLAGSATDTSGGATTSGTPIFASAAASGSAAEPFGVADNIVDALLFTTVINDDSVDIDVTISYTIDVFTEVLLTEDPGDFADGVAFAAAGLAVFDSFEDLLDDDALFAETDPLFGLPDTVDETIFGEFTFTLAPGDSLFIEPGALASGFAVVETVPLPAGLVLMLSGLAGLAAASRVGRG